MKPPLNQWSLDVILTYELQVVAILFLIGTAIAIATGNA